MKPRVFIASAGESDDYANAIQSNLDKDAYCTVETQGVMKLSRPTWENLQNQLDKSDFGIFVFSPGDAISARKRKGAITRDNVVLQLGMIAGRLGVGRTFIVIPRDATFKLPSDLLGITVADYDPLWPGNNLQAALGNACNKIRAEFADFRPPEQEVSPRLEARVGLRAALDPMVGLLAGTANKLGKANAKDRVAIRRDLKEKVLRIAVNIPPPVIGPAGSTRARYLALEPGSKPGTPMKLVPTHYVGGRELRGKQQPFEMNTEHGNYVIGKLLSRELDFYADLDAEAPPGFDPRRVDYRTFISAPVIAGSTAHGLLTADAPLANQLSIVDQDFVAVVAGLMATGLEMSSAL
jgi:hypothetical protein